MTHPEMLLALRMLGFKQISPEYYEHSKLKFKVVIRAIYTTYRIKIVANNTNDDISSFYEHILNDLNEV